MINGFDKIAFTHNAMGCCPVGHFLFNSGFFFFFLRKLTFSQTLKSFILIYNNLSLIFSKYCEALILDSDLVLGIVAYYCVDWIEIDC